MNEEIEDKFNEEDPFGIIEHGLEASFKKSTPDYVFGSIFYGLTSNGHYSDAFSLVNRVSYYLQAN